MTVSFIIISKPFWTFEDKSQKAWVVAFKLFVVSQAKFNFSKLLQLFKELLFNLFIELEVFDNGQSVFKMQENIVKKSEPLVPKNTLPLEVKFEIPKSKTHDVSCKIYATKNIKVPLKEIASFELDVEK